jgi:hypothetical protein
MAALLPPALIVAIAVCVFVMFKFFLDSDIPYVYNTLAFTVLVMFILIIYWLTLWTLNLSVHVLNRAFHRLRA